MRHKKILFIIISPTFILAYFLNLMQVQAHTDRTRVASIVVNNFEDLNDASPGDGVCETASGNNVCSLRASIQESNAFPGLNTIFLPSGVYTLTIPGTGEDLNATGDLDIIDDLIIMGTNITDTIINANQLDRVFDVISGTIIISDLTIKGGMNDVFGGGIQNRFYSKLKLDSTIVVDNSADQGGGIHNEGQLNMSNSQVISNTATSAGGGIHGWGQADLRGVLIYNNQNGGIHNIYGGTFGGTLEISNSSILSNTGNGGIISSGAARITITKSIVAYNTSEYANGGIRNLDGGYVTLENTTVSQNKSFFSNVRGGGIYNEYGEVNITNCTIVSNTVTTPDNSGGIYSWGGEVTLKNSIIASNSSGNCGTNSSSIISNGHNLDNDGTCNLTSFGDLPNTNPLLDHLQDNGGSTLTHALLYNSPAIDSGDNVSCAFTDQRGYLRITDGNEDNNSVCDIGAYEYNSSLPRNMYLPMIGN